MISNPARSSNGVLGDQDESEGSSIYRSAVFLSMLDRIGCGYLVIEGNRKIIEANTTARAILGREESLHDLDKLTSAFKQLIARSPNRQRLGALSWIAIWGKQDAPFILNQFADDIPVGMSVVMLLDLADHPEPNPVRLQSMFGLTMAETRLALRMAHGDVPRDVARNCQLSPTTIRSQLAALFAKTNTNRQAELVTLLARVAVLP
ncbi:helix-turn-helix transcriptional regulator [Bosea sp. BIWAKO-01]|uniref:helix-turn-helix transcriptional regulator n=1 Tax=Bosea sp. BIWAKO-01 TaxID=506668 RepID=UPI00086BE052|nr:helix-turn-helix transcriptional regulator [Bosea sp. BIWAKO-01]GAU86752.1 two component system response regulator [Bosea sp. BIWAKO-01]